MAWGEFTPGAVIAFDAATGTFRPASGLARDASGNLPSGAIPISALSISGSPSGSTFLRGDDVWAVPSGGGGGLTFSTVEKDIGGKALKSGAFEITGLAGLTADKQVLVSQAVAAYTGKGTLKDEASMNMAVASGYVLNATTIRVYWHCSRIENLKGNVKWNYAVSG